MADGNSRTSVTDMAVTCGNGPWDASKEKASNGQRGGGGKIPDTLIHTVVVDMDLNQPDMAAVTVDNANHQFTNKTEIGDPLTVELNGVTVFKGELVGLEPTYKTGGETKCILRAFNRMHRLLRGRHSETYEDVKDSDIVGKIAQRNGLTAAADATSESHFHIYQHNQTDLEFLLHRADVNGFEVFVEDKELVFRKPKDDLDSGITLVLEDPDAAHRLKSFSPRLSSASIVSSVEVRGWDPIKKEPIVERADAGPSALGAAIGPEAASAFGEKVTYDVDHPSFSPGEAKTKAESLLRELMMDYVTGDGVCFGSPDIKAGIVVTVQISEDKNDRFNGKYLVTGASHRYSHTRGGGGGGYTTAIRVKRDATGSGGK